MQETWILSLGQEYPLEKEMETYTSIFAKEIPCTEEPAMLQSVGLHVQLSTHTLSLMKFHPIHA